MRRCSFAYLRMITAVFVALGFVTLGEAGGPLRNPLRSRTSVEHLAEKLDKLEKQMQYTGRITVKAPDVWGQARLTAHREEFERQMAAQLTNFKVSSQAQIAISDQAFLSQAMALSAAASGQTLTPPATADFAVVTGLTPTPGTSNTDATSTAIFRTGPFKLIGETEKGVALESLALEPEIQLDQQKRYLDHLHEIRRVNEGDDTADAPGYSLNLVRVPVSVLPGDRTRENFGAEVTLIAEPVVTDELLPSTFRELVINDVIDQLALPMVRVVDRHWEDFAAADEALRELSDLQNKIQAHQQELTGVSGRPGSFPPAADAAIPPAPASASPRPPTPPAPAAAPAAAAQEAEARNTNSSSIQPVSYQPSSTVLITSNFPAVDLKTQIRQLKEQIQSVDVQYAASRQQGSPMQIDSQLAAVDRLAQGVLTAFGSLVESLHVAISRERRSRYPVAPSQLRNIYGDHELAVLALGVFRSRDRWHCPDRVSLTDVQGLLRNELEFAYDYLSATRTTCLASSGQWVEFEGVWESSLMPSGNDIRQPAEAKRKREAFFQALPLPPDAVLLGLSSPNLPRAPKGAKPTEVLAWAILVESALLNQHLNADLKRVSLDPNCECVAATGSACEYAFYGANPPPDARQAFAQYVKCRWPIRVFALDPVIQQQNVSDTFSLRREMQLAIALAFKQRLVNTQSLTRYMRRIEFDLRTISLNNTHIGFGAGDDTFGWRFFPRVQTPDIDSNLKVLTRDLLIGGPTRDQRLKRWRLESGMRECVAIVVMPSFIRHVRFDVRTNWFELAPCDLGTALKQATVGVTLEHTVEWSKSIRSMEDSVMACVKDEHKYRPGEVERLLKRAQQLSRQLPLNTLHAQVPYENTLGGFEMFSSGVTDLAPELVGFYGAPGIDPAKPTTLFLVGNHFSTQGTEIVAGNLKIDLTQRKMLSREVIQITVPPGARIEYRRCRDGVVHQPCPMVAGAGECTAPYIEVRLATPYGVSSPLYVPAILAKQPDPPAPAPALGHYSWQPGNFPISYLATADMAGKLVVADADIRAKAPHRLAITMTPELAKYTGNQSMRLDVSISSWSVGDKPLPMVEEYQLNGIPLLASVPINCRESAYWIEGSNIQLLHSKLRNELVAALNSAKTLLPDEKTPQKVSVKLKGVVTPDDHTHNAVNGELEVVVTLKRKA